MTVEAARLDAQPVGGGLHGITKMFTDNLAAATEKEINFGKYKLENVDEVCIVFGVGDNGAGTPDTYIGTPDTTVALEADGESIKLEDVTGGPVSFMITGQWGEK